MKEFIRKYLDIKDPVEPKDWTGTIESMQKEIADLTKELSKVTEVECANCGLIFATYPYGGGYYTSQEGRKFHSGACLEEYLEKKGK